MLRDYQQSALAMCGIYELLIDWADDFRGPGGDYNVLDSVL